jgi:tRNA(Ile)-lysidine synthase
VRGSHAPSLRTIVRRTVERELGGLVRGRVVCAVSGGPDSMAMLDVLAGLAPLLALEVLAVGVDHGLRPDAAIELGLAAAHADRLGVPFRTERVAVPSGSNLQARARDARYDALERARLALGADFVATAHTADDRAETVLLRMLRGSGLRGLGVLPARSGTRIRPLLRARRADVLLHLERHRVPFATDPSNTDPRFLRSRVRGEVLPLLASLDPRVVEHLNDWADEAASLAPEPELLTRLGRRQRSALETSLARGRRVASVAVSDELEAVARPVEGAVALEVQPRRHTKNPRRRVDDGDPGT